MTANVKIVAVLTARADTVDRLHALLDAMLKPSRAEPGNLRYDLADAVAAHRATPHFQNYLSQIGDLAERAAFVLNPVSAT